MQVYLYVKNFGKINEAEINISNFSIFVGNNNSGKTYLMQLIYGVMKHIRISVNELSEIDDILQTLMTKFLLTIDKSIMHSIEKAVNKYLDCNKEEIIYDIFRNRVNIEKIGVRLELEEHETYSLKYYSHNKKQEFNHENLDTLLESVEQKYTKLILRCAKEEGVKMITITKEHCEQPNFMVTFEETKEAFVSIINEIINTVTKVRAQKAVYIPSSRTGLMLLYRDYFANKTDEMMYSNSSKKKNLGLTVPVYEFLRILQTTRSDIKEIEANSNIISFIENSLIDGHIDFANINNPSYTPKDSEARLPLYLSSSMVNEIAPIIEILISEEDRKYIIFDEIETSLHPSKQVEMARLLNRMNNAGYKLIVSTHSDTMATKINNLLLLSFEDISEEEREEKLNKLNLTKDDLLQSKNVHVYQFVNDSDGKSTVSELEFHKTPYTGYDFSLFNENVMNLYEESKVVMGLDK